MDTIPEIICTMLHLEELDLSQNAITKLPIGCFTRLDRVRVLDFAHNRISEIRKGTFEGLQQLQSLALNNNEIKLIEHGVFSNKSDLENLSDVQLGNNQLTSLDSWPFVRAQSHPGFSVRLSDNRINSFTNNGNWSFRCGMKPLNIAVNLNYNPIKHISDILGMFDIRNFLDFLCMAGNTAVAGIVLSYDMK